MERGRQKTIKEQLNEEWAAWMLLATVVSTFAVVMTMWASGAWS